MNTKYKKPSSSKKTPSNLGGFIQVDREVLSEIDYLDKLTPEEREWYERFLDNEYNYRFHKDGQDVITSDEDRKAAGRHKYDRENDFTNKMYSSDAEGTGSYGGQILTPKPKLKKQLRKPRPKKQKPLNNINPNPPTETLEEFLAKGGNITKVETPAPPPEPTIIISKTEQEAD